MKDKSTSVQAPLLVIAAKGSILTVSGSFFGKSMSFLLRFLVIRLLGAKSFGFFAIALVMVEFVRILASIGLPKGGMRFLARALGSGEKLEMPQIIATALFIPGLLSVLCSALLFCGADLVANSWFHEPELAHIFRLFAMAIPFVALLRGGAELSRAFFTTRFAVLAENFIVPVSMTSLFLVLYYFRQDFKALVYAFIVANCLGGLCILFYLFRQLRSVIGQGVAIRPFRQLWFGRDKGVELVSYSFPLFLSGITAILMNSIDIFMLGRFVGAGLVGVYAAASMVAIFLSTSLVIPVNSIFAPLVAGRHGRKDHDAIQHLYVATTRWLFFFSIPLISFVIISRKYIMTIFGGSFVEDGAMVLLVLAIGHLVNCLTGGVGQILSMTGHPKKELCINFIVVILNIGLNLLLIPRYGIIGAAMATSVAMILVNVLRIVVVHIIFKMQPFTGKLVRSFTGAFVLVSINLLLQVYVGRGYDLPFALVTCAVLTWFVVIRGLESEDREVLREVRLRFSLLIFGKK